METEQQTQERIARLCNGDTDAMDFLARWAKLAHRVDDFVDGEILGNENFLGIIAQCFALAAHPFYVRHLPYLFGIVNAVLHLYADSVKFENAGEEWKQQFANCYRHAGNEMLLAVGNLCGGFDHAREFSEKQREICYATQHPEEV